MNGHARAFKGGEIANGRTVCLQGSREPVDLLRGRLFGCVACKSLGQLFSNAALTRMLVVGIVFVIVIREIDLSMGWALNFAAVVILS